MRRGWGQSGWRRQLPDADIAVVQDRSREALARFRTAYLACQDEPHGHAIDLHDVGTRVTAEDFETVRRALGIELRNVYGETYRTIAAMTARRLHPEHVRTVILGSVYPPDPLPDRSAIIAAARGALFVYCSQDAPVPKRSLISRKPIAADADTLGGDGFARDAPVL